MRIYSIPFYSFSPYRKPLFCFSVKIDGSWIFVLRRVSAGEANVLN